MDFHDNDHDQANGNGHEDRHANGASLADGSFLTFEHPRNIDVHRNLDDAPAALAAAAKDPLHLSHPYPGRLIAVEGIDGSGKSTQLQLLERWLRAQGYPVHFTEWNSSRLVRRAMRRGKQKNLLTPTTFSLLHAVDFADRFTYQILPPLKAGMIVLADRYVFTAFARDVARGVHPEWIRSVYRTALRPDLTLYFRVPIEVSLERLLAGRAKLKYHEAGMDLGLSSDPVESFRLFQSRVLQIYDDLTTEFSLQTIDASGEIPAQQKAFRQMVQEALRDYDHERANHLNGHINGNGHAQRH
jgi:dTMP kinase